MTEKPTFPHVFTEQVEFPDLFSTYDEQTPSPERPSMPLGSPPKPPSTPSADFEEADGDKSGNDEIVSNDLTQSLLLESAREISNGDGNNKNSDNPNEQKSQAVMSNEAEQSGTHSESIAESSQLHSPLPMSLRERVRPGNSKRAQFPLVPAKAALLIIDIQEYLSSPSSVQEEERDAYFFRSSLPRTVANVEKLLDQVRKLRDAQSQGCEVIFTYLEALTQDCRDVSLDYKLSGPQLATLPNSPACPAAFLESVAPRSRDGKGDILIPKTSCSVFCSTNLHYVLQNLHIEQLLVCGQLTDQCVESAVRDAADLGYFVTVIEDACAAKSQQAHEKGLSGMKGFSRVLSTDDVLSELQNPEEVASIPMPVVLTATDEEVEKVREVSQPEPEESSRVSILSPSVWSPPFCNETSATAALLHTLQFAGVQFLRYMAVDACNSIRGKAVPLRHLAKSSSGWTHQVSIATVCFAGLPTFGDYMLETTRLDARDTLHLEPDISTLRILPYSPTSAVVLGVAKEHSTGNVSPLCTRGLLARVVETAYQHGIAFNVGAEIEFGLFNKEGKPVDHSVFGNTTTLNKQESFINDLVHQLQQQQIDVEQIHAESAPGQMEIVLEYQESAVVMADWVVLTRETILAVAKNHGLQAIFLPKTFADKAGNGCHLHLSFRDTKTGRNIFPHATLKGELSFMAKSFIEGILRHLPALVGLTLPTNNSFRRVGPGCWTGAAVGWATEDKEASLRVCMDASGQWSNLEYKVCDSTANIYLALSAVLACGLDGILQQLPLRPSLADDDKGATPLPSSLLESLECLQKDGLLLQVMGRDLSCAYIAVRQAEAEQSANMTLEEEVELALRK